MWALAIIALVLVAAAIAAHDFLHGQRLIPDLWEEWRTARADLGALDRANQARAERSDVIVSLTKRIVEKAAQDGDCVIVGRGAAFFLANRPDVFNVFIYAPHEHKLQRLIKSGMHRRKASSLVETVDDERADFIRKYFGKEWPCRRLYHLMINSRAGDEAVVRTILNAIATHEEQPAPPVPHSG